MNNLYKRSSLSYKDPHGYVLRHESVYYRMVDQRYERQYRQLADSGLYDLLVKHQLLLPFEEVGLPGISNGNYKTLLPEQLEFTSYPYEWSFDQWKDCLECFLKINRAALKHGMILKDATPFNFTLHKGRFVLFDILSFEFYNEGDPWIAYRQFCENFLAPLSLMRYKGLLWSKLYRSSIHGFDLGFTGKNLPFSSYFNLNCLLHIHLHSGFRSKKTGAVKERKAYLKKEQLLQMLATLSAVGKWKLNSAKTSFWNTYYKEEIETEAYLEDKVQVITTWLQEIQPQTLIDLGANTGKFSILASQYAKCVIAIESDPGSVEVLYHATKKSTNIYPVCADLTDPSPGMGWNNMEKNGLLNRLQGDTVMALALVHHLRITYNVPVQMIAELFAQITSKYLVLEFVPKSDEKVKAMLAHRDDIYNDYSAAAFESACSEYFELVEKKTLHMSERILFLWQKK